MTAVAAGALCLAAGAACTDKKDQTATPPPPTTAAEATTSNPTAAPTASTAQGKPIPNCVDIVAKYPKGIYRSVGPYPGETGKPDPDLQYRYCNTAGYAEAAGKVTLTTVVTIYRPTTDPYRGVPLATWLPRRTGELAAERCAAGAAPWAGGEDGKRCATGGSGGMAQAVVVGAGGGAALRVEVSGALPRGQVESAADRIAKAVLAELR